MKFLTPISFVLFGFLILWGNMVSGNLFETYYKTLIGNLEGESLEHIYDHMDVHELMENAESFSETCLNETYLESQYVIGNSSNVTSSELITLCPALLYRALVADECGHDHDEEEEEHDDDHHETTGYGYTWGFLSIFLISLAPILGLPLLMFQKDKLWFVVLLQFLVALGVSTMACDSLMHLWPEAVGLHAHDHGSEESGHDSHDSHGDSHGAEEESHSEGEDRTYLWRTVGMVVTLYVFYLFEGTCQQVFRMKKFGSSDDSHGHGSALSSVNPADKGDTVQNGFGSGGQENGGGQKWLGIPKDKLVITLVLSMSDFLCNFTDGLAVGTAFQDSSSSGISTSIAVACHEIPQEIGSFAILLNFGVKTVPVLLLNLLSAVGAFIGLFMGAGLSEYENFAQWMTAFAAGAFLYIALIDMFPQMMNVKTKSPWLVYLVQHAGLILGFVIMLLIALYEEDINV